MDALSAQALQAQALGVDIDQAALLALLAVQRQAFCSGLRQDFLVRASSAIWAKQKSLSCYQFTTLLLILQYFLLQFFGINHKIYTTSSKISTRGSRLSFGR